MKAIDKNNKIAKGDRETARNKKTTFAFADYGNGYFNSQNSHKKTNKRK